MAVLLMDGMNFWRRIYAGVPGVEGSEAHLGDVVRSMQASLSRCLGEFEPTHAIVALEGTGAAERQSWRHQLLPSYKQHRSPMSDALKSALPVLESEMASLGVKSVAVAEFEADDVIASIGAKLTAEGRPVVIVSTDKSFCQLISPTLRVRDHFGRRDLDAAYVKERFGVEPSQLRDLFALAGDSALGISGVQGVGVKTAAKLVSEHGHLEQVLSAATEMGGRLGERLRGDAETARLCYEVVGLRTDVEVGVNLNAFRLSLMHIDENV